MFSRSMRRSPVIASALAATALVAGVARGSVEPPGSAAVRLTWCATDTHSAGFQGRMRWMHGTERMSMRFRLFERNAAGVHQVKASGLGRWRKSNPGVGTFAYRQAVRGLRGGSAYRMVVDFRWYAVGGALLESAQRRSAFCRQPEQLPNLAVRVTGASSTRTPGVVRYHVRLANSGVAVAAGIPVRLSVDGGVIDTVTVPSLLPGERRWLSIRGPDCTSSVEAAVDPNGLISESTRADDVSRVACADLPHT
jgi:hypothetical protein